MIRNARKDTNFGHADDRLSRLASQLLELERGLEFSYQEMREMHAPSECGKLISDGFMRNLHQVYVEAGVTENEFFEQMEERTSPRWVYFDSGIVRRGGREDDDE